MKILEWFFSLFFKPIHGAVDEPDKRDHIDELPVSGLPNKKLYHNNFIIAEEEYLKKKKKPLVFGKQLSGGCTAWGYEIAKVCTSICTGCGIITQDSYIQWEYQKSIYGANARTGDRLLNALKIGKKHPQGSPITEYCKIPKNDLYHLKARLLMGYCVYTGVSWKKTPDGKSNTYITTLLRGVWEYFKTVWVSGHCVVIVGYDDINERIICRESMKKRWGKNAVVGEFYVPYNQVENMMSMYIIKTTKK